MRTHFRDVALIPLLTAAVLVSPLAANAEATFFPPTTLCTEIGGQNAALAWDGINQTVCMPLIFNSSSGNIGIGTGNPATKLDVYGIGQWMADETHGVQIRVDGGTIARLNVYPGMDLRLSQNMTDLLTVQGGTGRVGIGTNDPARLLQVMGELGLADGSYIDGGSIQPGYTSFFTGAGSAQRIKVGGLVVSNSYAHFADPGNAYIEGKLGIGTTTPASPLDVAASGTALRARSTAGTGWGIYAESASSYGIYGKSTNPSFGGVMGYDAQGTYYGVLGYGNAWSLYGNGSAYIGGTYQGSDSRLKERVKNIDQGLDVIAALRPVSFYWKREAEQSKDKPGRQFGFIAQEVQKVLPEAVRDVTAPPALAAGLKPTLNQQLGVTKALEYNNVVPFLVKAVQELKAENSRLREEFEAYKASAR